MRMRSSLACAASDISPASSRNKRALVRGFKQPLAAAIGSRERAFFVAEEFAFEQSLGECRTVHGHKWLGGSRDCCGGWPCATNSLPVPVSPVIRTVAWSRRNASDAVANVTDASLSP